jgi:exopolysaccharide biosynthesis polyprenyl glycosylphosphotransferase
MPEDATQNPKRLKFSARALGPALLTALDLILIGVALAIGYVLRFELEFGALDRVPKAPPLEYVKIYALLSIAIITLCRLYDLYRADGLHSTLEETYALTKAILLSTGLVLALTFFYRGFSYSRLTFAYFAVLSIALLSVSHFGFRRWLLRRYQRGLGLKRAVLIGSPHGHLVSRLTTDLRFGVRVLGTVSPPNTNKNEPEEHTETVALGRLVQSAGDKAPVQPLPCLGDLENLGSLLDDNRVDEIIITDAALNHRHMLEALQTCEDRKVKVTLIPPVYDLLVQPSDFAYVDNVPLLRIDERRFRRLGFLWKRLFDVTVSALLLVLLSPLLTLIMVWIRLDSRGPALFFQERAGERGHPFRMVKLRTMTADAPTRRDEVVDLQALSEPVFKVKNDPRITNSGRLLRRTSVDELPQLWNVLKGDMSLVGPRPEETEVVKLYDVWQRRRLKVKPGITGLQQVTARGSLSTLNERVRLDVYYIRKQSFLFDLVILFRTLGVVLSGRGAS